MHSISSMGVGRAQRTVCVLLLGAALASPALASPALASPLEPSAVDANVGSRSVYEPGVQANALLAIDQNRTVVVDRIVGQWGDSLRGSNAGITSVQLREMLMGLRADHLLAASLAGSLTGLRDVLANSLSSTTAVKSSRLQAKALGDLSDDLVYTPIMPCRILDTRHGTTPPYNAQLVGGSAFPVAGNLVNFAPQGGSSTDCNLPAFFAAIAVTLTVLNPNFDAFMAAGSSSIFATLTQTVVMDFSANKGLANTAIVPVDGTVKFYLGLPAPVTTHVIADVVGYFRRPTNYGGTHVITGLYATDSGGLNNTASGYISTVAGGDGNTASGHISTVGGGEANTANGSESTVAGGGANTASALLSTVGGGDSNTASGGYSAIAGGIGNTAIGFASTVGGGLFNTASGHSSAIGGGFNNEASGDQSFAAGRRAKAMNNGCFVWADSTDADFVCTTDNTFIARAAGGVKFYTSADLSTNCSIAAGGGSWACTSSRDEKADFAAIDAREVLARVAALPLSEWRYRSEISGARHVGPMAQDFHAAFGLGDSDTTINLIDSGGIALAAIQGLHHVLQEKNREIARLKARSDLMERKLQAIEAKLGLN